MKKIEAIIRTEKLEDLKKALGDHDLVHGMTVSQVLGFGEQKGFTEYLRGQRIETTLLSKIKIEIVSIDEHVDEIVEVITQAVRTGEVGDGKIFIQPIERVVRIRTGEEDRRAL
ncbi:P-II family nitrogen regulator [Lactococcus taiwanensis]|uniref:P-II family nitrogen regulator n=1 Tax=Lactococcus taiwanensis TaxID=1151742 RepID=A0AA45KFE1_9LACT|nr:P-II family nitrogen regulator [Lactococcus taiwanensis]KZK37694.1 Nitrogen regulatory protein P-II [Lactococcus cremoris]QSE76249.1 P-II family nitrogen regulator [Lactococcus taiwanensis]